MVKQSFFAFLPAIATLVWFPSQGPEALPGADSEDRRTLTDREFRDLAESQRSIFRLCLDLEQDLFQRFRELFPEHVCSWANYCPERLYYCTMLLEQRAESLH